jgi:hypothetical protein
MNNQDKKKLAQTLFIKSSLSRREIAQQIGVTEKTLRTWIDTGNWDELKDSQTITRGKLLQDALNQLSKINEKVEEMGGIPDKHLSDAKAVVRKEIELFSANPLHKYVEVFEEYISFLSKNYPAELSQFAERSVEFINELATRK